jgi:YkoY family integral membrane protein
MEVLHSIFGSDLQAAFLIILNLILIESLLSVDNAAVLATMVMDLPEKQRRKALKYGIIGAYVFRGLCLLFATYLIHIWWLKPLGGMYLLYLAISYFVKKATPKKEDDLLQKKRSKLYQFTFGKLGPFWATVIMVEIMDLAFSLDNVFAAVAYVENYEQPQGLYLVWIGVFIGILAMRFVAQAFVKLMEKFPFLEKSAFLVIGILGVKLTISIFEYFYPGNAMNEVVDGENSDVILSLITVGVFILPILTSILLGYPKRHK